LRWDRRINRLDLVERFGVSPNQATHDLKRFLDAHPGALDYDASAKTYRAGPGLPPAEPDDARALLRELRLIAEGVMDPRDGMLAEPPPVDLAEPPARPVPASVLASVVCAIREGRAMEAVYQSFSAPEPRRRRLEPHALVFDGFRWHARARDADEDRFRDFVLGRLSDLTLGEAAAVGAEADREWTQRIVLEIVPHPGLAPHQSAAIAADYGMTGGRLILEPRRAVAFYVKRRLGLVEGHEASAPNDQHIVLASERIADLLSAPGAADVDLETLSSDELPRSADLA
jgi:predicted DNA-binding transcriptional regulator YafY